MIVDKGREKIINDSWDGGKLVHMVDAVHQSFSHALGAE